MHRVSVALALCDRYLTALKDLCKSNYVVQWHPESLSTMRVPLCRPRVFLTDFEMAYEFPSDIPSEERLLTGLPIEGYMRPVPPEIASGKPYDPFKADVWQLAESFSDFRVREARCHELHALTRARRRYPISMRFSPRCSTRTARRELLQSRLVMRLRSSFTGFPSPAC